MPGQQYKTYKNSLFKFGISNDSKRKHKRRGEFVENLNKVINSWLYLKQYVYRVPSIEIPPDLLKKKQCNSKRDNSKARCNGRKKRSGVFVIDLKKLDDHVNLSNEETVILKRILSRLECKNEELQRRKRESGYTSGNYSRLLPANVPNESKFRKPISKTKPKIKVENAQKGVKVTAVCSECQREKHLNKSRRTALKRLNNTIGMSEENIYKTLMHFKQDSIREEAKPPCIECTNSCSMNCIFGGKQRIKINNIEFKYLNPTYFVQYNNNNISDGDEENGIKPRDRLFSSAALAAHLGKRRMTVHDTNKPTHQANTMHYDDPTDTRHLVGLGQGTEEMIRERRHLTKIDRISSSFSDPGISYPRFPQEKHLPFVDDDTRPYDAHYIQAKKLPINPEIRLPDKRRSTCKKLKLFLIKCLCLSNGDDHKARSENRTWGVSRKKLDD